MASSNDKSINFSGDKATSSDDAFWSFIEAQSHETILAPEIPTTYKQYMLESKKLIHWLKRKYGVPHGEAIISLIKKFTGLDNSHIEAFEKVREGFDGIFSEAPDEKLLFVKVPPFGKLRDERTNEAKMVYKALMKIKQDLEIHQAWLILEQEEKEIISDEELFENEELLNKVDLIITRIDTKKKNREEIDPSTENVVGNLIFQMVKRNDMMKNRLNSGVRNIKYLFGILKEEGVLNDINEIDYLIEKSTTELARMDEESDTLLPEDNIASRKIENIWNKMKGSPPKGDDVSRKLLLLIGLKQRNEEIRDLWRHNLITTNYLRGKYFSVLIWGKNGISRRINRASENFVKDIPNTNIKERTTIIENRKEQFRQDLIDCGFLTEDELHLIIVGDLNMKQTRIPGSKIFSPDINEGILNAENLLDHIAKIESKE